VNNILQVLLISIGILSILREAYNGLEWLAYIITLYPNYFKWVLNVPRELIATVFILLMFLVVTKE
jgi:hypothetical protein